MLFLLTIHSLPPTSDECVHYCNYKREGDSTLVSRSVFSSNTNFLSQAEYNFFRFIVLAWLILLLLIFDAVLQIRNGKKSSQLAYSYFYFVLKIVHRIINGGDLRRKVARMGF